MKQLDAFRTLGWDTRGKRMCHRLTAGILVLVLLAQFGCASTSVDKRSALDLLPPSPGEAIKVAVTSGRFAPEFEYNVAGASSGFVIDEDDPSKGTVWGASKGAVKGFFAPLQLGAAGTPFVLPIIAVLMPVGLVAGAIEGAKKAESGLKAEEQEAMTQIVADQKIQDDLRDRVAAIGRVRTPHTFTVFADHGPTAFGDQPDYRPLSQEGIEAVLEVVVKRVVLGGSTYDRSLTVGMTVETRLVRTVDNGELYANSFTYSIRLSMPGLTTRQTVFRNGLNQANADIAERIVKEVFLRTESN